MTICIWKYLQFISSWLTSPPDFQFGRSINSHSRILGRKGGEHAFGLRKNKYHIWPKYNCNNVFESLYFSRIPTIKALIAQHFSAWCFTMQSGQLRINYIRVNPRIIWVSKTQLSRIVIIVLILTHAWVKGDDILRWPSKDGKPSQLQRFRFLEGKASVYFLILEKIRDNNSSCPIFRTYWNSL